MKHRIAIDLGGTKTEIMLTAEDPLQIISRKRVSTHREKGYPFILKQLVGLIRDYQETISSDHSIGIGIPGSINPHTGLVRNSNTLCLNGQPLQDDLEAILGRKIYIENDANCFTLSEATLGAARGYETVIGLIMGTGMGGGLVIKNNICKGTNGIGGEFGHTSIDDNGRECWCGQKGCLEQYISGSAIESHYQSITGDKLPLPEIYRRYLHRGDPKTLEVIQCFLEAFGRGVANIINAFDPEIIVIGGGVSNLPLIYDKGLEEVHKRVFTDTRIVTPIVQNQLGDSSGIFGAAMLSDFCT